MQATRARLLRYIGSAVPSHLPPGYDTTTEAAGKAMEAQYSKVTQAKIQGTTPHKSAKDPTDERDVITVSFHTNSGTRVASAHIHDDGTYNVFPSRNENKGK